MAKWTPCDEIGYDGMHHCPYADTYSGYEDEMCRNCCGLGVDGDEDAEYEDAEYEEYDPEWDD